MWKINIEKLIAHFSQQDLEKRDCAIGKVGQKNEMRFRMMLVRAISDSIENTTEIIVISYL